jgi:hydrogenase maturation protease
MSSRILGSLLEWTLSINFTKYKLVIILRDMNLSRSRDFQPRNLIIGIGNEFRGDDAIGIVVVTRLRQQSIPGYKIIEYSGEGSGLVNLWKDADKIIVIDAAFSGAEPGTIYRFEIGRDAISVKLFKGYSTHAIGLAEAIELSRTLDSMPKKMIVYGIEGKSYETGRELSEEVIAASEKVIARIIEDIAG